MPDKEGGVSYKSPNAPILCKNSARGICLFNGAAVRTKRFLDQPRAV